MIEDVIISIKPEFVSAIKNGTKLYEYRKQIFKRNVDRVIIYSTAPEKQIIGFFKYSRYLCDKPEDLWEKTKLFSGVKKEFFFEYFKNHNKAYAIEIKDLHVFEIPIDVKNLKRKFTAPQSFMYVKGDFFE